MFAAIPENPTKVEVYINDDPRRLVETIVLDKNGVAVSDDPNDVDLEEGIFAPTSPDDKPEWIRCTAEDGEEFLVAMYLRNLFGGTFSYDIS